MSEETSGTPSYADSMVASLQLKNERLTKSLLSARDQLKELRDQIDRMSQPPGSYGALVEVFPDGTAHVIAGGRHIHVAVRPGLAPGLLRPGETVLLSDSMVVVEAHGFDPAGEVATVKEVLADGRVLVTGSNGDERVLRLSGKLVNGVADLRPGDELRIDTRANFALERVERSHVEDLVLDEVPDVDYSRIGGLSAQIEQIRDAVELPFTHPELYKEHHLRPPKGVLLYGPPGCGKTLIAKAVAHSLAQTAREKSDASTARSYFLNIKGPELLNKFVGETERYIRVIFDKARDKARGGSPVIVFFDEMEALFRTRGTGLSSDVETTIVPQLLSEIDGVEQLDNVLIIGASNREDMIDPAILRPGRLDVKIKIERPDADAAREIFARYLTPDLPIHSEALAQAGGDASRAAAALIDAAVSYVYGEGHGAEFAAIASGAVIRNIVDRAKKSAIKAYIDSGEHGISWGELKASCDEEIRENADLAAAFSEQ